MHNNLQHLNSLEVVSKSFNIPIDFLEYMDKAKYIESNPDKQLNTLDSQDFHTYIWTIDIPKRNKKRYGQYRTVVAIQPPYNNFYKELLSVIENKINENKADYIHENVHGFIKNKNILSNAKEHLNQKYIFKLDIKFFFASIKKYDLIKVFEKIGFDNDGASIFSNLCTYNGTLAEGFNTSPMLANLYCFDLDKELIELSQKYSLNYTRYSDDITFSSNKNNFPATTEISSILEKYNFELNNEKTIFVKRGQSQYVTGLSVSNNDSPRVSRQLKRRVRQKLYYLNKFDKEHFSEENIDGKLRKLYGNIVYILGIEKDLGRKYKNQFLSILERNDYKLQYIFKESPSKFIGNVYHYIDETDIIISNKIRYFGLSVVSILEDELKISNTKVLENLKTELKNDFRNGLTTKQKEKLFHYAEDNISVKEKYISKLRELPFEAFIIYIKVDNIGIKKQQWQEAYYTAFNNIIYKVLRRNSRNQNFIFFEENSKVSKSKLEKNLENIKGLPKFKIDSRSKNNILLSIPDYILGIFRDCIKKDLTQNIQNLKKEQKLKEENKLNEILDKIRLVIDFSSKKYYSRQENNKLNCRELNKSIANELKEYINNKSEDFKEIKGNN